MSEKRSRGISLKEGTLVVKNKKFKKTDIIAFGVCLFVALFIWIYASNVKMNSEKHTEVNNEETVSAQSE
jgi:hypothetical protein